MRLIIARTLSVSFESEISHCILIIFLFFYIVQGSPVLGEISKLLEFPITVRAFKPSFSVVHLCHVPCESVSE